MPASSIAHRLDLRWPRTCHTVLSFARGSFFRMTKLAKPFQRQAYARTATGIACFDELMKQTRQRTPEHRLVSIEDIGNLVCFLVNDAASALTGNIEYIDPAIISSPAPARRRAGQRIVDAGAMDAELRHR